MLFFPGLLPWVNWCYPARTVVYSNKGTPWVHCFFELVLHNMAQSIQVDSDREPAFSTPLAVSICMYVHLEWLNQMSPSPPRKDASN